MSPTVSRGGSGAEDDAVVVISMSPGLSPSRGETGRALGGCRVRGARLASLFFDRIDGRLGASSLPPAVLKA